MDGNTFKTWRETCFPTAFPPSFQRAMKSSSILLRPTMSLSILERHLQTCKSAREFHQIHAQSIVSGLILDTFAASRLLFFSSNAIFVDLDYSSRILFRIQYPNAFLWNTLMRSYLRRNSPSCSLSLYKSMLVSSRCVVPDNHTLPILLQASGLRSCEFEGKQIHAHAWRLGFESDVYVVNTLVNMYSVCGNLKDARYVFDESPVLDSVSWNSILAAYVQAGDVEEAVEIFGRMPLRNTVAANSMIALFGRSKRVGDAREVFHGMFERDMMTWSAMISCYEQSEMLCEALDLFLQMVKSGVSLDEVVMVSVLSLCARLGASREGELMHGLIIRMGLESYVNLQNALIHKYSSCKNIDAARQLFDSANDLDKISWNSMISGYLKCGLVEEAKKCFDAMPEKDVVSWSTMISGYSQHDRFSETLDLFNEMQKEAIRPDETTLVSVISACARLSALEQGKWVHAYIRKYGFDLNVFLGTTLVDMYMKCGCTETALDVFNEMQEKGVSTWNAVILGLAMNGLIEESLEKFSDMEKGRVLPNEITFMGVLGACRNAGLVDEGRRHFTAMNDKYNVAPNVKHYGCMVDILGRAGLLEEAEKLIESMPMAPDVATWGALLGACKKYGDTVIGERLGRRLIELEPKHDGFHVLLSNLYASKGKWDGVMELRGKMKQSGVVKTPGCSMIECKGVVHEFLAGERSHPQIKDIDEMLKEMTRRLRAEGYEPNTSNVAFDIEEEEKETAVHRHSEKLAIAFGLINTSPSEPIRIIKNLRICDDCHIVSKIISRAFEREIVIRDRRLFHHFKQGICSCGDYW